MARGIKWDIDAIKEWIKANSECTLLSTTYKSVDTKLLIECYCGEPMEKTFSEFRKLDNKCCRKCYFENFCSKYNYINVKKFVEVDSNSNCKLISTKFKNVDEKLEFECHCGNPFSIPFKNFLKEKRYCNDCGRKDNIEKQKYQFDYVKRFIEENTESILLSSEYVNVKSELKLKCSCNEIYYRNFEIIKKSKYGACNTCTNKQKNQENFFESLNFILKEKSIKFITWIEDEKYRNRISRFVVECPNNHINDTCLQNLYASKTGCRTCANELLKGSGNPSFKGNMALYEYGRKLLDKWKRESMISCNYKCVLSGGEFDVVHHLYSFHLILEEMIDELNIPVYEKINEYTDKEMMLIERKILDLHYKYGLGVCLRKDIHILFHQLYGKSNNTPEQFEEFKQKYNNGELDHFLNKTEEVVSL